MESPSISNDTMIQDKEKWLNPGMWGIGLASFLADGLAELGRLPGGALADDPQKRRSVALGGHLSTAALAVLIEVGRSSVASGSVAYVSVDSACYASSCTQHASPW